MCNIAPLCQAHWTAHTYLPVAGSSLGACTSQTGTVKVGHRTELIIALHFKQYSDKVEAWRFLIESIHTPLTFTSNEKSLSDLSLAITSGVTQSGSDKLWDNWTHTDTQTQSPQRRVLMTVKILVSRPIVALCNHLSHCCLMSCARWPSCTWYHTTDHFKEVNVRRGPCELDAEVKLMRNWLHSHAAQKLIRPVESRELRPPLLCSNHYTRKNVHVPRSNLSVNIYKLTPLVWSDASSVFFTRNMLHTVYTVPSQTIWTERVFFVTQVCSIQLIIQTVSALGFACADYIYS